MEEKASVSRDQDSDLQGGSATSAVVRQRDVGVVCEGGSPAGVVSDEVSKDYHWGDEMGPPEK